MMKAEMKRPQFFLFARILREKRVFSVMTLAFAMTACSSSPALRKPTTEGKESASDFPTRVIDAHVHVHFTGETIEGTGSVDSAEGFLAELNEVNGRGAVAHTSYSKDETRDFKALKVTPCLGLSKNPNPFRAERAIRSGKYRCFKIYLGYQYQYANHPRYKAIYRIAAKHGVPVVFHTGDTYDVDGHLKYADPLTIDEVAVEFRKVKFVIAHVGNPWIQSAAEVAYKNPNVYIDVSALLVGDLKSYPEEQLEEYVVKPIRWTWGYVENPTKLMFATDWPLVRIRDYLQIVKRAIPREHWDRFFYLNAAEVFGIQDSEEPKKPN